MSSFIFKKFILKKEFLSFFYNYNIKIFYKNQKRPLGGATVNMGGGVVFREITKSISFSANGVTNSPTGMIFGFVVSVRITD